MTFWARFIVKIVFNGVILYAAPLYVPGFTFTGGFEAVIAGAFVLTFLNVFIRPILKLFTSPLLWITFGLFSIVIHVTLLWFADQMIAELAITNFSTLFGMALMFAFVNSLL